MSTLKLDKITGLTGNAGDSAPITLSGDTATLETGVTIGSGVTIPAAGITGTIGSGVAFPAGHIINVVTVQTREINTSFTAPASGNGVIITPLTLPTFTPTAGNKVYLEWQLWGEVDHDTVWIVTRNDVILANSSNSSNDKWAGIGASPYDTNWSTTPSVHVARIFDEDSLGVASTYKLLCRSSENTATHVVYLNRTVVGASAFEGENTLSTGVAMEIQV
jgi:hypothetical protein